MNNILYGNSSQEAATIRSFIKDFGARDPVEARDILLDTRLFVEQITDTIIEKHSLELRTYGLDSSRLLYDYVYINIERTIVHTLYSQVRLTLCVIYSICFNLSLLVDVSSNEHHMQDGCASSECCLRITCCFTC